MKYLSLLLLLLLPVVTFGYYDTDPAYVDLYGQVHNSTHTDTSFTLEVAVNTKQQYSYPYSTSIVVACYDAEPYDFRKKLVASTTVNIQGIHLKKAAYATIVIPKTNERQSILCHVDDTNVVKETNDSNRFGRYHISARKRQSTPTPPVYPTPTPPVYPTPIPPVYPTPTPPVYPTPVPVPAPIPQPPICVQVPITQCSESTHSPRGDEYMSGLGLEIPSHLSHIEQYRIQWFNGSWSKWYTPGQGDIDRKTNCDPNTRYISSSSNSILPPTHCSRRVRSYFDDHTYQTKTCKTTYKEECTPQPPIYPTPVPVPTPPVYHPTPVPQPPIVVTPPTGPCPWGYCDFEPLPVIDPIPPLPETCYGSRCGGFIPLPEITPPVKQDPPIYVPPVAPTQPKPACRGTYCGAYAPVVRPTPIKRQDPPVYKTQYTQPTYTAPIQEEESELSTCLGADCFSSTRTTVTQAPRRVVDPESVHTRFSRGQRLR